MIYSEGERGFMGGRRRVETLPHGVDDVDHVDADVDADVEVDRPLLLAPLLATP